MRLTEAKAMTERLITEHLAGKGWSFRWSRQTKGYGACDHMNKKIMLSKANTQYETEDATEQTVLHEIAHALAGPGNGHNRKWKMIALSIGVRNPSATRPTSCPNGGLPPAWVTVFGNLIVTKHWRKPSPRRITNIHKRYIIGRKKETLGNLEIMPYMDYQRRLIQSHFGN